MGTSPSGGGDFFMPDDLRQRRRTLYSSDFLVFYNRTKRVPCIPDVIQALGNVVDDSTLHRERATFCQLRDAGPELQAALRGEPSGVSEEEVRRLRSAIVAQWTGVGGRGRNADQGKPLFSLINRALVQDNKDDLEHMVPFIRLLNSVIRSAPPKRDITVWRGSKISWKDADALAAGTVLRDPMYLAASLDIEVARVFAHSADGGEPVLVRIAVPKGCCNASVIHRLSNLQEEREVLFPPYSAFRVTGHTWKDFPDGPPPHRFRVLECEVLDNMIVTHAEQVPGFALEAELDISVSGPVAAVPL